MADLRVPLQCSEPQIPGFIRNLDCLSTPATDLVCLDSFFFFLTFNHFSGLENHLQKNIIIETGAQMLPFIESLGSASLPHHPTTTKCKAVWGGETLQGHKPSVRRGEDG